MNAKVKMGAKEKKSNTTPKDSQLYETISFTENRFLWKSLVASSSKELAPAPQHLLPLLALNVSFLWKPLLAHLCKRTTGK